MAVLSRRAFLAACAWAPVGAAASQGLGQFAAGGPPPCKPDVQPTPAIPVAHFRPGSPERSSLADGTGAGTRLVLSGSVSGVTCGPLKRTVVEFWQADARGIYDDAGFRLRGHQLTGDAGDYRLETIVPGALGPAAPRIYVQVRPANARPFSTALFLPDEPRNQRDRAFRPELTIKRTGVGTATFDIVLSL